MSIITAIRTRREGNGGPEGRGLVRTTDAGCREEQDAERRGERADHHVQHDHDAEMDRIDAGRDDQRHEDRDQGSPRRRSSP